MFLQLLNFLSANGTATAAPRFSILAFRLTFRLAFTAFCLVLTILSSPALSLPQFVPPPPPQRGEPGNRSRGGGTRSPECDRYADLTPLVPSAPVGAGSMRWGLTTMARPTVWIAAPLGLTAGTLIELRLQDSHDRPVYQSTQTAIATAAGSFSLSIPDSAPALQTGELYRWTVLVFCDPQVPDVPIQLEGYIQRVAAPAGFSADATSANPLQQAGLYAEAGIWYDSLTILGNQYKQKADPAIAAAWESLLQQVQLQPPSNLPVGACCR